MERETTIRPWTWKASVGLRTVAARRDWMQVPLSAASLCNIVNQAARRANIAVPHATLALRKGFAIRATRAVGPVQTAAHMRLKRTTSLEAHLRLDRANSSPSARAGRG